MLYDLLGDEFKKKPFEEYGLLSRSQKKQMLDSYAPLYADIAREYLNRSDGVLFYEVVPDGNDENDNDYELTLEAFVPIAMTMLFSAYRIIITQRRQINQLRAVQHAEQRKFQRLFPMRSLILKIMQKWNRL